MATTKSGTSPAQRLLDAASTLFVREGIRAVGIERILSRADVARASLYQTFGSKDALVVAYLDGQDESARTRYTREAARLEDPRDRVLLTFDLAAKDAKRQGFRGCLYLNALTEFPEAGHPVRLAVDRHRARLAGTWAEELTAAGLADPGPTVAQLMLLYDGGLAGCKSARSAEPVLQARDMAAELLERALPRAVAAN
ncbi:TetR/AcrR family transcriptional regulator [Streptomyces gibsoniae]|uniref:Helix-turn-helix domain-containing protein n=1 Tax=Streptomyces gibsoniae TaxID=3075529 RepID=A0ABU2TWW1_9ACTN|nr:helix-turn-helix domain-containing protein [Streptomyces sp. DSM 41699]MDT0465456.1 helix-turn-helix domain-containing protein [Streptomyces sp. DSM 41699]